MKDGTESGYDIRRTQVGPPEQYCLVNPSGIEIAFGMSWRVARRIADALNTVRWQS